MLDSKNTSWEQREHIIKTQRHNAKHLKMFLRAESGNHSLTLKAFIIAAEFTHKKAKFKHWLENKQEHFHFIWCKHYRLNLESFHAFYVDDKSAFSCHQFSNYLIKSTVYYRHRCKLVKLCGVHINKCIMAQKQPIANEHCTGS